MNSELINIYVKSSNSDFEFDYSVNCISFDT